MNNENLCKRLEIIAEDLSKPMNATINEAINLLSKNNNYNVIKKLLGSIEPVGETNTDNKTFENLENTIDLIDKLLFDISMVSKKKSSYEYSVKKAGKMAADFLRDLKDSF